MCILGADKIIPPHIPAVGTGKGYSSDGIAIPRNSKEILKNKITPGTKPLVVFIGGALDDKTRLVLRLYARYYTQNHDHQDIAYATWGSSATIPIIKAWYEAEQKICLVGHSWGGDSEYKIVKKLEMNTIDLMCTIDPVSRAGVGGKLPKPKNLKKWYNVAIDYKKVKFSINNLIAQTGGPWFYCMYADKNFIVDTVEINKHLVSADHAMAEALFFKYFNEYVKNFATQE
ncbi:alpha/beta hydrolase [Ehrlichia canis]|uniref:alpha/beta hydrolase n=1 Tax=Ehrlichia canis TaxID=944 RepID=UPI000C83A773|nr:alpha/beta hydrolase [Ehrlichia canis]AUO54561.1 hypothetical protein C1I72_01420 [Ehrlichia canis]UKC53502.1 hypothetical protein s20019040002_000545 [Ehrlichia canis]UKC54441.1 hypothetical protein s20026770001_000547 [Ehrlichia canis]UKC55377.1 hypothetical protein s21009500007_000547 [Ehrlichia canis]